MHICMIHGENWENPILPKNNSYNSESKISPTIPIFFRSLITPNDISPTIPNLEIFQKNKSYNSESGNYDKSHNSEKKFQKSHDSESVFSFLLGVYRKFHIIVADKAAAAEAAEAAAVVAAAALAEAAVVVVVAEAIVVVAAAVQAAATVVQAAAVAVVAVKFITALTLTLINKSEIRHQLHPN
jgi:hypothetical protein